MWHLMAYWVYILHSKKLSKFYTGYTSNLDVRFTFHQNPESRKFTYRADDWEIFYKIKCQSQKQAIAIESHIKKMKSKTYIQNLKKYPEISIKLLQKFC
ncbi:GIY-YIG nuclease family protein [Aequorivita sp. Q41]|uniref:GIY-YIG nuclease family protein n=1 Tax=Aequorivita sp. Q41 TaxID=3153300 RepID=UPI0032427964